MPERSFGRVVVTAIALGFLALLILGLTGAFVMREAQRQAVQVEHAYRVENALQQFKAATERLANARRGFLLTQNEAFAERFEDARGETDEMLATIGALVVDNPAQRASLARLQVLADTHELDAERSMQALRGDPTADPGTIFLSGNGVQSIVDIRALALEMIASEQTLLQQRLVTQGRTTILAYVVLGIGGLFLLLVAAGTIWAIDRNLKALQASRRTLQGLNELLEGAVRVRTADLQRANDEIQRFAYIVSHDLRSPLVNVMGFTSELDAAIAPLSKLIDDIDRELPGRVSEDARLAVKEDLPEAVGFIRTSTQKMDRLINAILRLSREGRRVITPEALDVARMMSDIVDSLKHRLDTAGVAVSVAPDMPEIVSDRVAVEQIFSNLVENAVKYLKPGRPGQIEIRGHTSGRRAMFEVKDNGRGIDPKDHERVFDLFRRSGQQDQPGEGIGLAHVRALAYRLGGIVSCESALDEGATFRLSMPLRYEARQES